MLESSKRSIPPIKSQDIFGGEIQYFRISPEYWDKILIYFKEAGLRCVSTYVPWSTHLIGEPDQKNPAGMLDFEGRTDACLNIRKFIDLVAKHGLSLNIKPGPFCCTEMIYGGYPKWLVMGDPKLMVWDYQNRMTPGYWTAREEGSQPSYLHPDYLDWCSKWINEIDKLVLPNLKSQGGCITMLQLDNEISYIIRDGFLGSDYNPVNVQQNGFYHQFLRGKYGSIDSVPYNTRYKTIEDIPAPRDIPGTIDRDLAYYLDWCEFKEWVMSVYIEKLRQMHVSNGVEDVMYATNFNPHRPEGIPTRMPTFERATNGICGYDFYRGTFLSYSGYHSMARILKLMNASLSYTWSAEFMSGTWFKTMTSRVPDEDMQFMALCALAHGCKAIQWYMFHDRDCWGDSPVSSHGHKRSNWHVLKNITNALFAKNGYWDTLIPQGDVAVIYDLVQHQHTYLGDPMPCNDGELYRGAPQICGIDAGAASSEYEGLFRLVEQCGVQANVVDIVHSEVDMERYPLAFLPGSPVIERSVSATLSEYVKHGGSLVVTGPWPIVDETGKSIDFLGITKQEVGVGDSAEIQLEKGRLYWVPRYIGHAKPEEESLVDVETVGKLISRHIKQPAVRIAIQEPIKWVDWKKPGAGGGTQLFVQPRLLGSAILHTGSSDSIVFVLNHYPEAAKFDLRLRNKSFSRMTSLFTGQQFLIKDGTVTVDLDRKSGEVYYLE